jgi:phosphoserine aminotransferase
MEMSHRGEHFQRIAHQAEADLREILAVPGHFKVLFMQGGAMAENAIVPMNLSRGAKADYIITGSWSLKSAKEAQKYCHVHVAASNESSGHQNWPDPATWSLRSDAAYVHACSNETIDGVEMHACPDLQSLGASAPLVLDCSSNIASRPIDWTRVSMAYAGAQKNLGPAGLTLVIIREDLLGHAMACTPSAFDYAVVAKNDSMYNTPPTYAIYMAGLVFQWIKRQTEGSLQGLAAIERRNQLKAQHLYACIDQSGFYRNSVDTAARSRMNVPFFLPKDALNAPFLAEAQTRGLLQLKGHKSVGGMRASIYNAMPTAGVNALVGFLQDFAQRHG